MDSLFQDVRYALRLCVRAPAFTAVAVLALAIGIGANTAIFTIVNAVLIEPLPFRDPSRLVALSETSARRPGQPNVVAPANFLRWQARAQSFESMAALFDGRVNLTSGDRPEELTIEYITADFFDVVGLSPLVGRTFSAEERADPDATVTILSYELWQRRFGGDSSVVGRTLRLNDRPITVIGVMPSGARLQLKSGGLATNPPDLWVPWVLPDDWWIPRGRFLSTVARLKPAVTVQRAQAELTAIATALAREFPEFDTNWGAIVRPVRDELSGDVRPALLTLAGAVAFVLLIACANVANLLLARGAVRQREIAIRAAVGAGRIRVARQLLTESVVLGLLGGAAGLIVGQWSLDAMLSLSPTDLTNLGPIELSMPVLLFTIGVSFVTAVICGVIPAIEASRTDVHDTLKDGARQLGGARQQRLRQVFVVAELSLAVVLLVGAGLMLRSFDRLQQVDPGFQGHDVVTMRLTLPGRKYDTPEKTVRFYIDALERVRHVAGVRSAGAVSFLPLAGLGAATKFEILGRPLPPVGQDLVTDVRVCDDGYFETLRIPLVRGRLFTAVEMLRSQHVVVINEALAREYFRGEDPIGKRLRIHMTDENIPTTIIGIVGNTHYTDLATAPRAMTYWPHPELAYNAMTLVARTAGDPLSYTAGITREIQAIDKDQPVSDVRTMDQWVARTLAQARFSSMLLTAFAAVALLLAAIGIYGVLSYAVNLRTPEIGIRLALGAQRRDIVLMVLRNAAALTLIGLAAGVALAFALTRAVASLLYGVTPTDPATFAAVVGVLAGVAVAATYLPARRASSIAPVEALRNQ